MLEFKGGLIDLSLFGVLPYLVLAFSKSLKIINPK